MRWSRAQLKNGRMRKKETMYIVTDTISEIGAPEMMALHVAIGFASLLGALQPPQLSRRAVLGGVGAVAITTCPAPSLAAVAPSYQAEVVIESVSRANAPPTAFLLADLAATELAEMDVNSNLKKAGDAPKILGFSPENFAAPAAPGAPPPELLDLDAFPSFPSFPDLFGFGKKAPPAPLPALPPPAPPPAATFSDPPTEKAQKLAQLEVELAALREAKATRDSGNAAIGAAIGGGAAVGGAAAAPTRPTDAPKILGFSPDNFAAPAAPGAPPPELLDVDALPSFPSFPDLFGGNKKPPPPPPGAPSAATRSDSPKILGFSPDNFAAPTTPGAPPPPLLDVDALVRAHALHPLTVASVCRLVDALAIRHRLSRHPPWRGIERHTARIALPRLLTPADLAHRAAAAAIPQYTSTSLSRSTAHAPLSSIPLARVPQPSLPSLPDLSGLFGDLSGLLGVGKDRLSDKPNDIGLYSSEVTEALEESRVARTGALEGGEFQAANRYMACI